ncbi:zinc ribbon domain-containing protein [Natronococcus occultus]|uniref:Uncharacterized protein n=1 Tax=Natronococcus occultus SP4 TaxID=694430 RepID=L0JZN9_9EURY|nr:hypothetical protein [Natronococcus occultus]AGB37569.1 hypothetical protein Natoc_1770 [Natronococcus occultus SP4]
MDPYADDLRLPRATIEPTERATVRCRDCQANFRRRDAEIPKKGTLRCPNCQSAAIGDVD